MVWSGANIATHKCLSFRRHFAEILANNFMLDFSANTKLSQE